MNSFWSSWIFGNPVRFSVSSSNTCPFSVVRLMPLCLECLCQINNRWWSKSHSNFVWVDKCVLIKSVQICYSLRSAGCIFQEAKNDDTILIMEQSKMKITIQNCGFSVRLAVPVWQQAHWDDTHTLRHKSICARVSVCFIVFLFVKRIHLKYFPVFNSRPPLSVTPMQKGLSACICLRCSFVGAISFGSFNSNLG